MDSLLLKAIYILCILPGIIGFLYSLFAFGNDVDGSVDSNVEDVSIIDSFDFKLSWTVLCNFLFCFGVVGYILYPSKLSLPVAIAAGCGFAYGYTYLLFMIHKFCVNSENKIPKPKHGMICISNTSLDENRIGSVIIRMNDKDYEYLAKSSRGNIPNNSVCVVMGIVDGIVYVIQSREKNND